MVAEKFQPQSERPVLLQPNDTPHLGPIAWLAVRSEPHHLVLVPVMGKPEPLGHRLVEDAERMRKIDFVVYDDLAPPSAAPCSARKIAEPVHRDYVRLVERRHVKRGRHVREMMLHRMDLSVIPPAAGMSEILVHARALSPVA